jgi:hypothetical protein
MNVMSGDIYEISLSSYIESLEKKLEELHAIIEREKSNAPPPQLTHRNRSAFDIFKKERFDVAKQDWKALGKEWKELSDEDRLVYIKSSEAEKENNMQHGNIAKVDLVYKTIRAATGKLGGNGAGGAIYGEVTKGGFSSIVQYLKEHCQFDHTSRFIDIGSGLGKPNFHAAQDPMVRLSIGVELINERYQLAMVNLKEALKVTKDAPTQPDQLHHAVNFLHMDIDLARTLNPFTHIYSFDVGFPPELLESIAQKFNRSQYAEWFISYQPPTYVIDDYGFKVDFLHKFCCNCHGSGEGHTVYFYRRNIPLARASGKESKCVVTLPPRAGLRVREKAVKVRCDPAFLAAVQGVTIPTDEFAPLVGELVRAHLDSRPPKRARKSAGGDEGVLTATVFSRCATISSSGSGSSSATLSSCGSSSSGGSISSGSSSGASSSSSSASGKCSGQVTVVAVAAA